MAYFLGAFGHLFDLFGALGHWGPLGTFGKHLGCRWGLPLGLVLCVFLRERGDADKPLIFICFCRFRPTWGDHGAALLDQLGRNMCPKRAQMRQKGPKTNNI